MVNPLFPLLFLAIPVIALQGKKKTKKNPQKPTPQYPVISQREFTILAKQAAKKIKRINSLKVDGAKVYGFVTSQSKISEWKFKLDFGNIDKLTGRYSEYSENDTSDIPGIVAKDIKEGILAYPNTTLNRNSYYAFCPHCGKRLSGKPGNFCPLCGAGFTQDS